MFDRDSTTIRRLKRAIRELERRVEEQREKSEENQRTLAVLAERTRMLQEEMNRLEVRLRIIDRRLWSYGLFVGMALSVLTGLLIAWVGK